MPVPTIIEAQAPQPTCACGQPSEYVSPLSAHSVEAKDEKNMLVAVASPTNVCTACYRKDFAEAHPGVECPV